MGAIDVLCSLRQRLQAHLVHVVIFGHTTIVTD